MPTVQQIVPRSYALQHDGSNGQDIADLINTQYQQTMYTVTSQGGGTLVLHAEVAGWDNITMSTNDYIVLPDAQPCTPAQFAARYNLLP